MPKVCHICEKRPASGNRVSHANNRSKRRFMPNLQRVRVIEKGHPVRVLVCTRCLKAGKVRKAP